MRRGQKAPRRSAAIVVHRGICARLIMPIHVTKHEAQGEESTDQVETSKQPRYSPDPNASKARSEVSETIVHAIAHQHVHVLMVRVQSICQD
jgi:hypothetical protein